MQMPETQPRKPRACCCICKQGTVFEVDSEGKAINPEGFDPCALTLVTNAFGPRANQREQDFPCHMECFRRIVNDDSLLYILKPDFATVGEFQREQGQADRG
jgi:hypothetical protein